MSFQEVRTGHDEALTWRIRTSDDTTAAGLLKSIAALDDDEMLFIAALPSDWTPEIAAAAEVVTSFSILDVAYLVAGPQQRARAAVRRRDYRVVFVA